MKNIGILIFDDMTALDAVGPYEVLSRLPDTRVAFISPDGRPIESTGGLKLLADKTIHENGAYDVILVPGGAGIDELIDNKDVVEWLRKIHNGSTYTVAVCTGTLLLGKAGLLNGLRATTHWLHLERLTEYGAIPLKQRYVEDGKIITSAGVSAGIDMSLRLAELLTNRTVASAVQLAVEYDPAPPFDSGSPDKAPEEMVRMIRRRSGHAQGR